MNGDPPEPAPDILHQDGDVTRPIQDGRTLIAHVTNDLGAWGRGVSGHISRRWPKAEGDYRAWIRGIEPELRLGRVRYTRVGEDLAIAHMVAQRGLRRHAGDVRIDMAHLETCLRLVREAALRTKASVHMPRIGAGLAGGDWDEILRMIHEVFRDSGVQVVIYHYGPDRAPPLP